MKQNVHKKISEYENSKMPSRYNAKWKDIKTEYSESGLSLGTNAEWVSHGHCIIHFYDLHLKKFSEQA